MLYTSDEFRAALAQYYSAIGVAPWLALGVAAALMILLLLWKRRAGRAAGLVLAALWIFTGVVHFGIYIRELHAVGLLLGAAFVTEGLMLIWNAVRQPLKLEANGVWGGAFLLGSVAAGFIASCVPHAALHTSFGVEPVSLTLFTFGLFLWETEAAPRSLMMIPFVASFVWGLLTLNCMPLPATLLALGGVAGSLLILKRERQMTAARLRAAARSTFPPPAEG